MNASIKIMSQDHFDSLNVTLVRYFITPTTPLCECNSKRLALSEILALLNDKTEHRKQIKVANSVKRCIHPRGAW